MKLSAHDRDSILPYVKWLDKVTVVNFCTRFSNDVKLCTLSSLLDTKSC